MSSFTDLVLFANDPRSIHFQESRDIILNMKNSNPQLFLESIINSLEENWNNIKICILLLLLPREIFENDCDNFDLSFSPEVFQKFEIILLKGMTNLDFSVRYHASITFAIYSITKLVNDDSWKGLFVILNILQSIELNKEITDIQWQNTGKYLYLFDFFRNFNNPLFTSSIETSLAYLDSNISLGKSERQCIHNFIVQRFYSGLICDDEEIKLLLKIFFSSIKYFSKHNADNQLLEISNIIFAYSSNIKFAYFCFGSWQLIAHHYANFFNKFSKSFELFDLSLLMLNDLISNDSFTENKKLISSIIQFWLYLLLSDCNLKISFINNLNSITNVSLTLFRTQAIIHYNEGDSLSLNNYLFDNVAIFLKYLVQQFPDETYFLFIEPLKNNITSDDQELCFISMFLFRMLFKARNDKNLLEEAPKIIEIALKSPFYPTEIIGLKLIRRFSKDNYEMITQVNEYITICLNFLNSGNSILENESSKTIITLMVAYFGYQYSIKAPINYNIFLELIQQIFSLLSPNRTSSQISLYIETICQLTDLFYEENSLNCLYQKVFELFLFLNNHDQEKILGYFCKLFSSLFTKMKNISKQNNPEILSSIRILFPILCSLNNTIHGDDGIKAIGSMSLFLHGNFQPFLNDALILINNNIDSGNYVRDSLISLSLIMLSCNSSIIIPTLVPKLFNLAKESESYVHDLIVIYQLFQIILRLYFDHILEIINHIINLYIFGIGALQNLFKLDDESANLLALLLFEGIFIIIEKDKELEIPDFYNLLRNHFFFLLDFIVSNNRDLSYKQIAKIIQSVYDISWKYKILATDDFISSNLLNFLQSFLNEDYGDSSIVNLINEIFSILQSGKKP